MAVFKFHSSLNSTDPNTTVLLIGKPTMVPLILGNPLMFVLTSELQHEHPAAHGVVLLGRPRWDP